jgi:hypothetical protein
MTPEARRKAFEELRRMLKRLRYDVGGSGSPAAAKVDHIRNRINELEKALDRPAPEPVEERLARLIDEAQEEGQDFDDRERES